MSYLGYSYRSDTTTKSDIEAAGEDVSVQAEAEGLLTKLDAVETAIQSGLATAGLQSADEGAVAWFEGAQLRELRSNGRGLVHRLGIVLSIPKVQDYFGTTPSGGYPITFFG